MALHASFSGKRVLITGGGHGLGRKLVERLAQDGAIVVTLDKDASALERVKKKCPQVTTTLVVDLENWDEIKEKLEPLGIFDHLVNNAAMRKEIPFLEIKAEDFQTAFDINVRAIIAVTQVVAKGMIEGGRGGSIVNLSSLASRVTMTGSCLYSCTKSSVNMLTKSMALELAPFDIRVNCICPAFMETGLHSDRLVRLKAQPASYLQSRALIKRFIKTDEASDFVLFLLSPLSAMITGSDFDIDAGFSTN